MDVRDFSFVVICCGLCNILIQRVIRVPSRPVAYENVLQQPYFLDGVRDRETARLSQENALNPKRIDSA